MLRLGLLSDPYSASRLIAALSFSPSPSRDLHYAHQLFDQIPHPNLFTWNALIRAFASSSDLGLSRRVFDGIPVRDVVSWNSMIAASTQAGRPEEALELFRRMEVEDVKPNDKEDIIADQVTFVSVLSVCSQLGTIDLGRLIHASIHKHGITLNCHLATSLIDMYAKCGNLEKAVEVFRSVDQRDVFLWSAMMAGLAMHGHGEAAIELFLEMQEAKVKPNEVTFMNMLCACSHSGLVDKGRKVEHYGCMVDILGRAGRLDEALDLIENQMPMPPRASVWGALLGACAVHGNVKLGEKAFEHLVALEPGNDGAYVLMSNLYAKSDYWDGVAKLRKRMREMGMKKEKGCSSIEVDGVVYDFLVGDISHPSYRKIYLKLNEIASRLRSSGYVPNRSQLLQNVEDDDAKEQALYLHSEKLAIAFGLISTIRVMKNLRVCEDCHSFAKVVSSVYKREVVLRDRYRFHRFRGGECSCMDYW
ncbi:Pentatricopeptide repeat-containing protein [Acorus gramineus]|uniref:Pentatricopeptide repeat-containing protein n=1 Tax=Acorus gramineus TaxID=55184 RepID=A0AAV9B4E1_ACOGR|nr:Pentatricopeptide repeat-containing protein [Acorus gramineus]